MTIVFFTYINCQAFQGVGQMVDRLLALAEVYRYKCWLKPNYSVYIIHGFKPVVIDTVLDIKCDSH